MKFFNLCVLLVFTLASLDSYGFELTLGNIDSTVQNQKVRSTAGRGPAVNPGSASLGLVGETSFVCDARDSLISFSSISKFFIKANKIDVNVNESDISIDIPSFIDSECFKPKFSLEKVDSSESNGAQMFRLKISNDADDFSNYEGTMDQKILACFRDKEVIDCDENGSCALSESVKFTQPQVMNFTQAFKRLEVDITKPAQLVFGSPKDNQESGGLTDSKCFNDELLFTAKYLVDDNQAKDNNLVRICEENNLAEIYNQIMTGNLDSGQQNFLYTALRKAQEEYAREKYEILENLAEQITQADDYDSIRLYAKQYKKVADEIRKDLINPLSEELDLLIKRKKSVKNEEEKEKIQDEITKIAAMIRYYSQNSNETIFKSGQVIDKLLEHGLDNYANSVAHLKLSSAHYGIVANQASLGANTKGVSSATLRIAKDLKKFHKRSTEARIVYYQKTGVTKYSPAIKNQIKRVTKSRDIAYKNRMEKIQKELSYCQRTIFGFVKNPVRCRKAMKNQPKWQRQALSERAKYNKKIGQLMKKYKKYAKYEEEAEENLKEELGIEELDKDNMLGTFGLFDEDEDDSGSMSTSISGGSSGGSLFPTTMINPHFPQMGMGMGAHGHMQGGMNPMMGGGFNMGMTGGYPMMPPSSMYPYPMYPMSGYGFYR